MHESAPATHKMESEGKDLSSLFWNVNMPPKRWTKEPPPYLENMSAKDIGIMSTRDCDFKYQDWDTARDHIWKNQLERFQRLPSELRRYLKYIYDLRQKYGSVLSFIQHERLHWHDTVPSGEPPFANPNDYKILCNDWPYALEPAIAHLVVWVKFELESDETTGDITPHGRELIEDYVNRAFCGKDGIPRDQVIWFKNGHALKSVHALEHFHVLLYQASTEMVDHLTNGDKPMSQVTAEEEEEEEKQQEEAEEKQQEEAERIVD